MKLSLATVQKLKTAASGIAAAKAESASATSAVQFPKYNPKDLSAGILHVGVGNFHRAHLAAYMNDLFNSTTTQNKWGIVGTGVMPQDHEKRKLLERQDWLQTLVELDGAKGTIEATILAPMIDFTPIDYENNNGHSHFYEKLLDDNIKILSLTVTEGGYFMNNESKLNLKNSKIQYDIANPATPQTVFGLVCKALMQRKAEGRMPFTVMSCDNIPHNGNVTKDIVLELADQMFGRDLKDWIDLYGAFPNSMVDRIAPVPSKDISDMIQKKYGYQDDAPVLCEPFRQWVLEDVFVNGERPAWETLETVSIVPDVTPYENMKIRILNGGHASLCYPAALLGLKYVHEAIEHNTIGPFLDTLERTEIIPSLPPVPDTDLDAYWTIIASRFANPTLQDTILRVCFDGANRQHKFVVPVIKGALKKLAEGSQGHIDGLALVGAAWCRYCQGTTEAAELIGPNDPEWDMLHQTALEAKTKPTVWLDSLPEVYGSVGQDPAFRRAFTDALNLVQEKGMKGAMQAYIDANQEQGECVQNGVNNENLHYY